VESDSQANQQNQTEILLPSNNDIEVKRSFIRTKERISEQICKEVKPKIAESQGSNSQTR